MTNAQKQIIEYANQYLPGSEALPEGADRVTVIDANGKRQSLSMNLYGDIMDAETKTIIAMSDLIHDITAISAQWPAAWRRSPQKCGE